VVVRQERQWSAPVLITFSGAGAGLKAGFKTGSIVLVFTRHQELDSLLAGNLKLGTDLQVATGTNKVNSYVYDYSDELGLFAGIGIEGTAMQIDHILNEGLYGKKVSVATIFAGQVIPLADIAKDAMNNLKLWLTVKTK
jgi:lipid-binding SYLF domain-containing protein